MGNSAAYWLVTSCFVADWGKKEFDENLRCAAPRKGLAAF